MRSGGGVSRRAFYRVWQFFIALAALLRPISPEEHSEVARVLPPGALPLFFRMGPADQRHSLRVLRFLQGRGAVPVPVAQAALLHDCAKSLSGVRLWHRVGMVLLRAFAPRRVARLASIPSPPPASWRYPLWAYIHHPQRSAQLAAAAGCDPLAADLIACHQEHDRSLTASSSAGLWLAALQAADDDS